MAYQETDKKASVDRYSFTHDKSASGDDWKIAVNVTTKVNVYLGKSIKSLAIDDDQSILYVADAENKRIDSVQYNTKMLEASNSQTGLTSTLYQTNNSLKAVTSMAVDYLGNIFWSVEEDG